MNESDQAKQARRQRQKVYYQQNRVKVIARMAQHYLDNKPSLLLKRATYYSENYERVIVAQHNRQAEKRGESGRLSLNVISVRLTSQRGLCGACHTPLGSDFDVDHIVATSQGGQNIDSNIQLLHSSCNAKKWSLPNAEFLGRLAVQRGAV